MARSTNVPEAVMAAVEQGRRDYRLLSSQTAGAPDPVATVTNLTIPSSSPDYLMPARLYIPVEAPKGLPVLLYLHGGGWISGDLETHDVLCRALSNGVNAVVLAIEYRLAPEFQAPVGIEDSYRALQWLCDNAADIGGDKNQLILAGDSAGATIAITISALAKDRNGPQVRAQWLIYPCVEMATTSDSFQRLGDTYFPKREDMARCALCYVPPGMDLKDPLVSPIYGDLTKQPTTLITVGSRDPLQDGCLAFNEALEEAKVDTLLQLFDNELHGFIQFYKDKAGNPRGEEGLNCGVDFLRNYCK